MHQIVSILALVTVVLPPGWAAVARARRLGAIDTRRGVVETAGIAFAGVGLACLALWSAFMILGPSRVSVVAAITLITVLVWAAPPRTARPGNATGAGRESTARPGPLLASCAALAVVLVATPFIPYGQTTDDDLVHAMAMTDWEKHIVVATGITAADDFPPPHPYVRSAGPASYYSGFHLVAAAATILSGTGDVYWPLLALTLMTVAAMPFVVFGFARPLVGPATAAVAATGASLLAGFDLIVVALQSIGAVIANWPLPAGFAGLRLVVPSSHLDGWIHHIDRQFNAPLITAMWAPHHLAAALIALTVLRLRAPRPDNERTASGDTLLAGLLLGALPALSAYVALAMLAGVAGALARETLSARVAPFRTSVWARWVAPGCVALVVALPTYAVLSGGASSTLILAVSSSGGLANGAFFNTLFGSSVMTNLLDTPAVLLLDLGAVGLLAMAWLRRGRGRHAITAAQAEVLAFALAVVALAVFVRPPAGIGNNVYARGMLMVWFVLAPFAAVAALAVRRRYLVLGLVAICVLGTGYAVAGYVAESLLFRGQPRDNVEVMWWINANQPVDDVVAFHPDEYANNDTYWLRRPVALGNRRLARLFGATDGQIAQAEQDLRAAYSAPDPAMAARRFDAIGANTILVRSPWYRAQQSSRAVAEPDPEVSRWAAAPCFRLVHQTQAWLVIERLETNCAN
jgi:hypothetical protein